MNEQLIQISSDLILPVTVEPLGRNGFNLYQLKDGFRFGTDSVLLAWFSASFVRKSAKSVNVLELGSNTGAVSILMAARRTNSYIDSIEIMTNEALVLNENIKLNNLTDRMRGFNCDIRDLPSEVKQIQYDIVMANPPYFNKDRGPSTQGHELTSDSKLKGRFEENGDLNDFVRVASSRVKPSSGYVCMIMHGDRLKDVFDSFDNNGLKVCKIMAIHPFADKNASAFLIAGKKGASGTDLKILPPLIINERIGGSVVNTDRIKNIYDKEHEDCFI